MIELALEYFAVLFDPQIVVCALVGQRLDAVVKYLRAAQWWLFDDEDFALRQY